MSLRHLAVAAAFASLAVVPASVPAAAVEAPALSRAAAQAYPGETWSQYRRRGPSGGAVAAGVIGGLAAGAIIGGLAAQAQPAPPVGYYGPPGPGAPVGNVYGHDPNWVNYCASKYRSFDPASGTYLARDGYRYPCE